MLLDFTMLAYMALGLHLLVAAIIVAAGYTIYRLVFKKTKDLNAPQAAGSKAVRESEDPAAVPAQGQGNAIISRAA